MYIEYEGPTKEKIVSAYSSQQDQKRHPYCEELDLSDSRWKAFYEALDPFTKSFFPALP
jgi:hypothetical protein